VLREAAIVVLILGKHLIKAVRTEYEAAKRLRKRILILLKDVSQRDQEVHDLIAEANVKYARFWNIDEFRTELQKSLDGEIVRALLRPAEPPEIQKSDRELKTKQRLRRLMAEHQTFNLRPAFPPTFNNEPDQIDEIDDDDFVARRLNSGHLVTVSIDRVSVISTGQGTPALLQVDGRIQWLSVPIVWQFLPETARDGFGIAKFASPGDRNVLRIQGQLKAMGYYTQWNFEPDATHDGYQVVYDSDGYYFRSKARDPRGDQILAVQM
jgi:hypothetical protein